MRGAQTLCLRSSGLVGVPGVPRLPLIPDPLRRIRVPRDLQSVTTVGAEEDPELVGVSQTTVDRIWSAPRDLYRSGVHPAVQLCFRRNGRTVLNRAIGHAEGNGRQDPCDAPKVLATPETPFCVFSRPISVSVLRQDGCLHRENGGWQVGKFQDLVSLRPVRPGVSSLDGLRLLHRGACDLDRLLGRVSVEPLPE